MTEAEGTVAGQEAGTERVAAAVTVMAAVAWAAVGMRARVTVAALMVLAVDNWAVARAADTAAAVWAVATAVAAMVAATAGGMVDACTLECKWSHLI